MFGREVEEIKKSNAVEIIGEIREALVGVGTSGNSFLSPAPYSALGKIRRMQAELTSQRELISMLLDKLGLEVVDKERRLVKRK